MSMRRVAAATSGTGGGPDAEVQKMTVDEMYDACANYKNLQDKVRKLTVALAFANERNKRLLDENRTLIDEIKSLNTAASVKKMV